MYNKFSSQPIFTNMRRLLLLLFPLELNQGLYAQNRDSVYRFSLKQAVEFALQNQKDVVNAQLDAEISHQKVREITGLGLPQINSSFDVKDFVKIPTSLIPGEFFGEAPGSYIPIKFGTQYQATAGATLSQLLFDPTYLLGIRATKTIAELSQKSLTRTRIETAAAVYKAYYGFLVVSQRKNVIDANVVRVKKLRDDTKALYDNGFVEKIDVDRVTLTYNNLESEQLKFNHLVEITMSMLKFQIGMNLQETLILTDSIDIQKVRNLSVVSDKPDASRRIEYSILQTQIQLQEYNVKRYRSGRIPTLVAYGNLSTTAYRNQFDVFDQSTSWYPTALIGATLNVPLFDGNQRRAKIIQENYNLKKIQNELHNFEQAAGLEIDRSRSNLLDALNALQIQEDNLELANEIVKTTRLKYEQGVGTNIEVLDAETKLTESQVNYFNAIYESLIAKIDMEKALGNFNY